MPPSSGAPRRRKGLAMLSGSVPPFASQRPSLGEGRRGWAWISAHLHSAVVWLSLQDRLATSSPATSERPPSRSCTPLANLRGTLGSETSVVILARLDDMLHGIRLRAAERRERDERARAGEALAAFLERDARPGVGQLPETVRRLRGSIDALDEAIAHSLETDRADYATVSRSVRPLVILRGMCSRAILRNQRHRCNSDLRPFYEELGAAAGKRSEKVVAAEPRTSAVEPEAVPVAWEGRLVDEGKLLGRALKRQLHDRLFPRLPALAGLAAGWWVANTYTDSQWKSTLRSVGIGGGGTHVVSGEIYRLLFLGLPILSAAVCAYLGDRAAHYVRSRYAPLAPPRGTMPGKSGS